MRYGKHLGVAIFAILVAIEVASSFYITPFTISDTDPLTYAVVPLLMLPLFAIFVAKERFEPEVRRKDILAGILSFIFLMIITLFLRYTFSYLFLSYRIDMLLFPLLIFATAVPLFGLRNISRFKWMMLYSLLASPIFLLPVAQSNQAFAVLNTRAIYDLAGAFIHGLRYVAPITIASPSYQIGIGQACVSVGILVAIALFMLPLAYLYNGKRIRKAIWVISGFLLLLLFNFLRMLIITILSFTTGPSSALLTLHYFAGILLFYLAIIVAILASGKFGLTLVPEKTKPTKTKARTASLCLYGIILAVIIAVLYFLFTSTYSGAFNPSPLLISSNIPFMVNNATIGQLGASVVNTTGFNATANMQSNDSVGILIWGRGINMSEPIELYVTRPNSAIISQLEANNKVVARLYTMDKRGISGTMYLIESNSTDFMLYNTNVPLLLNGTDSSVVSLYFILPENISGEISCSGEYAALDTYAINILNPGLYNQSARNELLSTYCGLDRMTI